MTFEEKSKPSICLSKGRYFDFPYPHYVFEDFLPSDFLDALCDDITSGRLLDGAETVMGGRRRIIFDSIGSEYLKKNSTDWFYFINLVRSRTFVHNLLDLFSCASDFYKPNFSWSELKIDEKIPKVKNANGARWVRILNRVRNHVEAIIMPPVVTVEVDISLAGKGYRREIHHDSNSRIIAGVFYLNSPQGMVGGTFDIHSLARRPASGLFDPQPKTTDCIFVKSIKPARNTLVLFLSTPDSYHSVPEILEAPEERIFVYFAVTLQKKNAWKHQGKNW